MRTVMSVIWAKYFGRRHLGSITGISYTVLTVASALGPMPMGIARDLLGSYNLVLNVSAVFPLLLGVITLFAREPTKRSPGAT